MSTETKVSEYPAWQAKIREAQAEARRLEAQARDDLADKELEKAKQDAQKMRELLAEVGLEMPESVVLPSWEIDGYRFEYVYRDGYVDYYDHYTPSRHTILIYKVVPEADPLLEDESYQFEIIESLEWSANRTTPSPADLADALDRLDQKARDQVRKNADYIKRCEAVDNDADKYKQVALTLTPAEVNFILALREMIADSQSSSDSDW